MTTQPPPIEFKVRADARQAQQEMDGLNKKFKEGETASAMLDKRIEALTKDLDQLSTAVVSGKGNTEAYRAEMQRLERQLDALHGVTPPTSKAIESLGSSMEQANSKTRNVGQAALEASRAMEDLQYGVGGVVNNIPSLVMSLGGGAGLTAAISLGAVAVNQLVKNFGGVDPAAKEAAAAAKKHVSDLRGEIAGLAEDLRSLQVGAERAKMERQGAAVGAAAEAARAALDVTGMSAESVRRLEGADLPAAMQANVQKANDALKLLDLEISKLAAMKRIQNEKDAQDEIDRAVDAANAITAAEGKRRSESIKGDEALAKARYDLHVAHLDDEDKALKAVAEARRKQRQKEQDEAQKDADKAAKDLVRMYQKEARDEERARQKAQRDAEKAVELHNKRFDELYTANAFDQMALRQLATDTEIAELDRLSQHEFDVLKARHDQMSEFYESIPQMAAGALGVVAGASAQMIDGIITGQEHAVEQAAVSVLKQAGTFVVGEGIKLSAAGVAGTMLGNPLGPGQIAGGLALTGLGLSMGGAGAAWAHQLGGGTIGKALPDDKASRSDRGASPRSSSDSSSGGPLVVNISYGVGGPLPEDTAREVRKVLDVDSRR